MRRHDLLMLNPDAVMQSVTCCTSDMAMHYVKQWIATGRAFVHSRQSACTTTLQLGLAFVDRGVKHRAFIQTRYQDVLRIDPPHKLEDCLSMFSEQESIALQHLIFKLKSAGFIPHVFGSVAWEKISGEPYRTTMSDLDLLCDVATLKDVSFVTAAFAEADSELPFSIDGELRFSNDRCVNWREVLAALELDDEMEVLVKGETGVFMSHLYDLLELSYA